MDTLPIDLPVDSVRLLSNLKTYLETSSPLTASTASGTASARTRGRRIVRGGADSL